MGPQYTADDSSTGRHIPALDGVRGLALLLVLADHLLWSNTEVHGSPWLHALLSFHSAGWVGVDLFFVLSGFLITGILYDTLQAEHYFRNFYARRALRIFPLYYTFLLVIFAVSCLQGHHWKLNTFYVLTYSENLVPIGFSTDTPWININHFWSLAVEEQFYLFWPFLVFLLRKRRWIMAAAALGATASLFTRVWLWHTGRVAADPYILLSWTPSRLDGLLTGACLAMAVRGRGRKLLYRFCRPALWAGCALAGLFYGCYPGYAFVAHPAVAVWVPAVMSVTFAMAVATALRAPGAVRTFFACGPLRFFGRYSYGLYVFHPTVSEALAPLRLFLRTEMHSRIIALLLSAALTLGLSTALAWLSFHFFEKPWLRLKKHFSERPQRPTLQAFAAHPGRAA